MRSWYLVNTAYLALLLSQVIAFGLSMAMLSLPQSGLSRLDLLLFHRLLHLLEFELLPLGTRRLKLTSSLSSTWPSLSWQSTRKRYTFSLQRSRPSPTWGSLGYYRYSRQLLCTR
jgi:hypothetical protein